MVTRMTMSEPMAMSALMRPIFRGESGRAEEAGEGAVSEINSLSDEPEMEFAFGSADASRRSRSF